MSHYDSCQETEKQVKIKKEAYSYYEAELNQLGSAVELITAIANGLGEDGFEGQWATTTPRQVCDQWLEANGYECEATRAAQKAKRLEQLNEEIERLQKEKEAL